MRVRRVAADEWARLRDIRLRALATDPRAFGATWEEESALDEAAWRARASGDATPQFVAEEGAQWMGLVAGRVLEDGTPELIAMWTAPEARGRGVGRALVEAVVAWARGRGARQVRLWVIDENASARALYASCGFAPVGEPRQGRRDPTRRYQEMALAW